MDYQTTMRNFLRTRLFERLQQRFDAGETVLPGEIAGMVDAIREEELTVRV